MLRPEQVGFVSRENAAGGVFRGRHVAMVSPLEVTLLSKVLGPAAVEEIKKRVHLLRMNRGWKGPFAVLFDARHTYNVVALGDHNGQIGRFCHVLIHNASAAEIPQSRGI